MRTIKFRGKEFVGSDWMYGYLTKYEYDEFYIEEVDERGTARIQVEPETIGQFTRTV